MSSYAGELLDLEPPTLLESGLRLGGAALRRAIAIDLESYVLWDGTETEVISNGAQDALPGGSRFVAIAGAEHADATAVIRGLRSAIAPLPDNFVYSSRGFSSRDVGRALARYYDRHYANSEPPEQHVVAHSCGLPIFLKGVERCVEAGVAVPPLGTVYAFSSPAGSEDVYLKRLVQLVARSHYPCGILTKIAFEFSKRCEAMHDFAPKTWGKALLQVARQAHEGYPPRILTSQARITDAVETHPYKAGVFDGIITPDTNVVHFGDRQEKTVHIDASRRKLARLVGSYGARLTAVDMPGTGHANVAAASEYISAQLAAA